MSNKLARTELYCKIGELISNLLKNHKDKIDNQLKEYIEKIITILDSINEIIRVENCIEEIINISNDINGKFCKNKESISSLTTDNIVLGKDLGKVCLNSAIPKAIRSNHLLKRLSEANQEVINLNKQYDETKSSGGILGMARQKASQAMLFPKIKFAEMELDSALTGFAQDISANDRITELESQLTSPVIDAISNIKKQIDDLVSINEKLTEQGILSARDIIDKHKCKEALVLENLLDNNKMKKLLNENKERMQVLEKDQEEILNSIITKIKENPGIDIEIEGLMQLQGSTDKFNVRNDTKGMTELFTRKEMLEHLSNDIPPNFPSKL